MSHGLGSGSRHLCKSHLCMVVIQRWCVLDVTQLCNVGRSSI